MKSEGFLDDIEKIVDDAWDVEKKEINTHVDHYEKDFKSWMENMANYKVNEYQREYLREIEKRTLWDSPYSSTRREGPYVRPTGTTRHKCECGTQLQITYLEDRDRYRAIDTYGFPLRSARVTRPEVDHFHCPRCRNQINVIGKVIEITINMTE